MFIEEKGKETWCEKVSKLYRLETNRLFTLEKYLTIN